MRAGTFALLLALAAPMVGATRPQPLRRLSSSALTAIQTCRGSTMPSMMRWRWDAHLKSLGFTVSHDHNPARDKLLPLFQLLRRPSSRTT